jgi:hypothetical protein
MIHPGNCAWCKRPLIGAGHRWVGYVKVYTCKGCDKETFRNLPSPQEIEKMMMEQQRKLI